MDKNTNAGAAGSGDRQGMTFWLNDEPAEINRHIATKQIIRAELIGSTVCTACGITVKSGTPVLGLCKALLAAGLDPDSALQVYHAGTLALSIRNISEAAGLEVNAKGTGFVRAPVRTAPPMRKNRRAAADGS